MASKTCTATCAMPKVEVEAKPDLRRGTRSPLVIYQFPTRGSKTRHFTGENVWWFLFAPFLVTFVGSWNVIIWIHMVFLWNRIGYNQQTMGIPCGQSVNTSRFLAENIIKLYQTIGWFSSHVWLPESSTCLGLFLYLAILFLGMAKFCYSSAQKCSISM